MSDESRRPLSDSLRNIFNRQKGAPAAPEPGRSSGPPPPEPAPTASTTRGELSLRELLRYVDVLASADAFQASDLHAAQDEVDRRLVDAEQDADIESLQDAARRLQRRRRQLDAEEDDRLLRRPRRRRPPDDDDWMNMRVCMCSVPAPADDRQ